MYTYQQISAHSSYERNAVKQLQFDNDRYVYFVLYLFTFIKQAYRPACGV